MAAVSIVSFHNCYFLLSTIFITIVILRCFFVIISTIYLLSSLLLAFLLLPMWRILDSLDSQIQIFTQNDGAVIKHSISRVDTVYFFSGYPNEVSVQTTYNTANNNWRLDTFFGGLSFPIVLFWQISPMIQGNNGDEEATWTQYFLRSGVEVSPNALHQYAKTIKEVKSVCRASLLIKTSTRFST